MFELLRHLSKSRSCIDIVRLCIFVSRISLSPTFLVYRSIALTSDTFLTILKPYSRIRYYNTNNKKISKFFRLIQPHNKRTLHIFQLSTTKTQILQQFVKLHSFQSVLNNCKYLFARDEGNGLPVLLYRPQHA